MLSDQWFVSMDGLAKAGLEAVEAGRVRFVPDMWTTVYRQWLENIVDWCISRQLWWGHQIPAWYADDGTPFVGRDFAEASARAKAAGKTIREDGRDPDVLDTWFSSAFVPFSTLGWPDEKELARQRPFYLPSSVLVTGFDIIFFWVARMIMTTLHFTGEVPFREVFIHALVRDADGNKMSKSKGNTIDPLDVVDGIELAPLLEKSTKGLMLASHKETAAKYIKSHFPDGIPSYGADALRFTFAALATHGRDLNFDLKRCEGYRSFCNKLWNATRFVLMNCEGKDTGTDASLPVELSAADRWIVSRFQDAAGEFAKGLAEYRFDVSARAAYEFAWDEYCDWYVEIAKQQLATGNEAQQRGTRRTLIGVLESTLRLTHPIIPFITEELWQIVAPLAGAKGESIMMASFPEARSERVDAAATQEMKAVKEIVNAARGLRSSMGLPPGEKVPMYVRDHQPFLAAHKATIAALARLSELHFVDAFPHDDAPVSITGAAKLMLHVEIDKDAECKRLTKEIERIDAEVTKATAQLGNESFVKRAPPAIVEQMRKRLADFEVKRADLQSQRSKLGC
jgi:valyl-tRNA synthetase